jgi:hypothetical protein
MPKPKSSPEKKWLPLLGGSMLFGYLGCVPQGESPAAGLTAPQAAGRDTVARADTTVPVVVRPDTVRSPDPVVVIRNGPTLGEPCDRPNDSNFACTMEGVPVKCYQGRVAQGSSPEVSATRCSAGDTLLRFIHMGFNGIDKAIPQPRADRMVVRRMA